MTTAHKPEIGSDEWIDLLAHRIATKNPKPEVGESVGDFWIRRRYELVRAAIAEARRDGHTMNCGCHSGVGANYPSGACSERHEHPYTDPRCLAWREGKR